MLGINEYYAVIPNIVFSQIHMLRLNDPSDRSYQCFSGKRAGSALGYNKKALRYQSIFLYALIRFFLV